MTDSDIIKAQKKSLCKSNMRKIRIIQPFLLEINIIVDLINPRAFSRL